MPNEVRSMKQMLSLMMLGVLMATPAWAQFETGSVVGSLRDKTGGAIAGAKVTLTNAELGVSVEQKAGKDGGYEFFTVKPGRYVVTADQSGFALALAHQVTVQVGARQRVDLTMEVGQVSEKVEVKA